MTRLTITEIRHRVEDVNEVADKIGIPAASWHNRCHEISFAIAAAGIIPGVVTRGYHLNVGSQHSWLVPHGYSAMDYELIVDPTVAGHIPKYAVLPPRVIVVGGSEARESYYHACDIGGGFSPYSLKNPPPRGLRTGRDGEPVDDESGIRWTPPEAEMLARCLRTFDPDITQLRWLVSQVRARDLDPYTRSIYEKVHEVSPAAIPVDRAHMVLGHGAEMYEPIPAPTGIAVPPAALVGHDHNGGETHIFDQFQTPWCASDLEQEWLDDNEDQDPEGFIPIEFFEPRDPRRTEKSDYWCAVCLAELKAEAI